ncbi:hypothetical protein GJ744_002644 [Endocarpon pusillum]|uniref:Kinesin light chain n=1 Tax=Endocarpon pusillum TaxID=364733 RepID=A0A8H7ABK5_9EURO|nr:hypothetical protein GJ744_002644 [Endocarpon pusillum]
MYVRALAGYEKALGPDQTSTLDPVNNLGILYSGQGKLDEAGEMYMRATAGKEKALGPDHTSTLNMVYNFLQRAARRRVPEAHCAVGGC